MTDLGRQRSALTRIRVSRRHGSCRCRIVHPGRQRHGRRGEVAVDPAVPPGLASAPPGSRHDGVTSSVTRACMTISQLPPGRTVAPGGEYHQMFTRAQPVLTLNWVPSV